MRRNFSEIKAIEMFAVPTQAGFLTAINPPIGSGHVMSAPSCCLSDIASDVGSSNPASLGFRKIEVQF